MALSFDDIAQALAIARTISDGYRAYLERIFVILESAPPEIFQEIIAIGDSRANGPPIDAEQALALAEEQISAKSKRLEANRLANQRFREKAKQRGAEISGALSRNYREDVKSAIQDSRQKMQRDVSGHFPPEPQVTIDPLSLRRVEKESGTPQAAINPLEGRALPSAISIEDIPLPEPAKGGGRETIEALGKMPTDRQF